MTIKIASLLLILFAVIIIILGIVKVHELPGRIARQRHHPQQQAIHICSLLGLLVFPFWMIALIWAYMEPVFQPQERATNDCAADDDKSSKEPPWKYS